MIQLDRVCKHHDNTAVVVDVSLTVKHGESLALLGHSGSGKTSLLRLVAGLDLPDSGSVRITGRSGMLFQSLALWPHVTVRAQLELVLHDARWKNGQKEQRVAELLKLFGIQHLAHRRPGMLSGGEQQRVALARALAPDPEILLLDEPFAHLDAKSRRELRARLLEQLTGRTVLIATHDEEDANILAQRIARMRDGKLEIETK